MLKYISEEDFLQTVKNLEAKITEVITDETPGYTITISIKKDGSDQQFDYKMYDYAALMNELSAAVAVVLEDLTWEPSDQTK